MSPAATAEQRRETEWHPGCDTFFISGPATQWSEVTALSGGDWAESALRRLSDLGSLQENWDGYGSPPIPSRVFPVAFAIMRVLIEYERCFPGPALVPTSGGGIQFEWISGERELEVEVSPDGSVWFLLVTPDEPDQEGQVRTTQDLLLCLYRLVTR
jgi:hypothetical protein